MASAWLASTGAVVLPLLIMTNGSMVNAEVFKVIPFQTQYKSYEACGNSIHNI